MAVSKKTFQYQSSISLNRISFRELVVVNKSLSKKDLRVILHLICHLDGKIPKEISAKNIANDLGIDKKDVKEALDNLEMQGLVARSSTGSVKNGYILTF